MSILTSYRPWNLVGGDIEALRNPERNKDDRSPFVRYARSAAMWAEWVREGVAILDPESQNPTAVVDGYAFRYGLIHLDSLVPLVSVPPSAKDHQQRLLEATQLYSEPILVCPIGDKYAVVGNHELYAAAKAYQDELARPGKVRASDTCLVAVCDPTYLPTISATPLYFASDKSIDSLREDIQSAGFAVSPRTDDPSENVVLVGDETFSCAFESGSQWTQRLGHALGVRSMDFGSNDPNFAVKADQTKVTLMSPKLTSSVLKVEAEFPYGAFQANIKPLPGANMWSLRDFRVG
jgi:hypothetical protein